MGNRAVITTNKNLNDTGIYLHWNGSRDSVEAFLAYCDLKHYRKPEHDSYGYAMLINIITNYFGDGLSCDVGNCQHLDCDNGDNGVYIIKDWHIVDRIYAHGEQYEYDFKDMINAIDKTQPDHMRLTDEEKARIPEIYEDIMKYRTDTYDEEEEENSDKCETCKHWCEKERGVWICGKVFSFPNPQYCVNNNLYEPKNSEE